MQLVMNELYVMRHGETEWNIQKRYQGQLDSPLTERGALKIREQRDTVKDLKFNRIYCSPLGRCRQTLELLEPESDFIRLDDRLKEFHLGILQGKTHDQVPAHHQEQQKNLWNRPEQFDMEGAESFISLEERVSDLLKEVLSLEGPTLLITHTIIVMYHRHSRWLEEAPLKGANLYI